MDLIIHIGLPKTGTTTMQYELFSLPQNRGFYLGKFPESEGGFHQIVSDYLSDRLPVTEARAAVAAFLDGDVVRLYSNEMITVNSTISWKEKLAKLALLFTDLDVLVIGTTRTPSKLAPSVFAELLPAMPWNSFKDFLNDVQSEWLEPELLSNAIVESGLTPLERVVFFDFDSLINQDFRSLGDVIPGLYFPDTTSVLNSRLHVGNKIISRPIGPYDVTYRSMSKLGLFKYIPPRIRGLGGRALRALPFVWRKHIKHHADAPELQHLDTTYQQAIRTLPAYSVTNKNKSQNGIPE